MRNQLVIFILGLILLGAVPWMSAATDKAASREIKHDIFVFHPGIVGSESQKQCLVQVQRKGKPDEFYMDVNSVFCAESECKVVSVRIFWDELGFFKRYELAPGTILEKAEGKPFTDDDLKKLQEILADRDSPLRDVDIDQIVKYVKAGDVIDGSTGATVLLDRQAAVKGAAWTCYTLWHWVNGDAGSMARQITSNAATLDDLFAYLNSGLENSQTFALEKLTSRKAYDASTIQHVISFTAQNDKHMDAVMKYINKAPDTLYFRILETLFPGGNNRQRIIYLNTLLHTAKHPPDHFFDRFSDRLHDARTYQEVDLILNVMESQNPGSQNTVNQALALLENANLLIARRAYWFLLDQSLSTDQQKKTEAFKKQHSDIL